ncbi:MAG TPA: SAM-dependent methyltransferase [Nitrospirales bacterium]|nr:SAM-dependent methyltransferase [Nitrospirales bacterium]
MGEETLDIIKIILFTILQILLLPLFFIGFVMIGTKQIFVSKKLGLSGTAIDVLQSRWIQHYFGGRKDPLTIELAKNLPNMSHVGMCLAMSGVIFAHRLFNYTPAFFSVPKKGKENLFTFFYSRHLFFDEVFEQRLDDMEQVVLMGAGFDTRSFTFCEKDHLAVFELDRTNTQQIKMDTLNQIGVDTAFITFVPVDFNSEDWHEKLLAGGFEPGKKTLFLWEGVTLYLDEAEVRKTLQRISEISAPGSILALDLYSHSLINFAKKPANAVYKNTTGETLGFGLDLATDPKNSVEELLNDTHLQLSRIQLCGDKRKGKEPLVALVEALVR